MGPGRIPVLIVGGFLGSGKTSLLREMLDGEPDTAVIVNEFGAVGLDHELLRASEERVELVGGGCACCTRREDLVGVLRELLDDRDRGAPPLGRVVIETSGLADPAPIVFTITNDPMLRHQFAVERLMVTVDAVNCTEQLATHPEAAQAGAGGRRARDHQGRPGRARAAPQRSPSALARAQPRRRDPHRHRTASSANRRGETGRASRGAAASRCRAATTRARLAHTADVREPAAWTPTGRSTGSGSRCG